MKLVRKIYPVEVNDDVKEAEVEAQNSISLLVWMQKKRRQCNFVWARWR
ncbi:C6 transcription factor [Aspergillus luchuensis]|uniref:C6 transcription factor n=1 Tax=Aspergillus kawachii TaxID=1069201 RepID=A0A146FUI7_ASPKA|nr:C6 transcription factor [Aspergillus luchuensis]